MKHQKRPQRLLYPSNLTQRHTARLQIQLRRIYQRFRRGELFKMAALLEGEQAIKESLQQADVKAFNGITWEGNKHLEKTLQDTLRVKALFNDNKPRNSGFWGSAQHRLKAKGDYWVSGGILQR